MNAYKLFCVLLSTAAITACSSDDNGITEPLTPNPEPTLLPLTIEVAENPMVNPEAPSGSPKRGEEARATRAAIATTTTLSEFSINYEYGTAHYTNGTTLTATKSAEGKWTSDAVWPVGDETINWYAASDGTFLLTDDDNKYPYTSFTVEENTASQKDLLVAKTSAKYTDADGNVTFTFDHACTALRFLVKKATNLADYTLSITSVQLCNVINQGQYFYDTASWTLGSSRSSYTLYTGPAKTLGTTDYEALDASSAPYLFMIPQTLTAWDHETDIASATAQTYIQISCTITKDASDVFSGTAYIPFGATLAAGMQYDVKINIGKNSLYSSADTKIIQ